MIRSANLCGIASPSFLRWRGEAEANAESPTHPRRGFAPEEVEAEVAIGGKLPLKQVIRSRVRYLIDGGVFGSAAFVENVFTRHRERFGLKRKIGARRMREADWEDLCVLRDLKNDLIGEPAVRPARAE